MLAENLLPVEVYGRCADQWMGSGPGRIHIDNSNIETVIDLMGIKRKVRLLLFDRVKSINLEIAKMVAEEQERKAEERKK